jgi:PhzF family phenazine biosynthesis protein
VTEVRLRTIDAFTDRPFTGNPAAVVVLESTPPDEWMAAVARETNLSDTGFVLREQLPDADFRLRWFTRGAIEVDLCGHATLASAHCLFEDGVASPIRFATRSGVLTVDRRDDGGLAMDFPASPAVPVDAPVGLAQALGAPVQWTGLGGNGFLLALVTDEETVRELRPDIAGISQLSVDVVVVTARAEPGREYDFVSRVFAPKLGLNEDPVTGSAHTVLAPYWTDQLGRDTLTGFQASARSGVVGVHTSNDRVIVSGRAVTILDGILASTAHPS